MICINVNGAEHKEEENESMRASIQSQTTKGQEREAKEGSAATEQKAESR